MNTRSLLIGICAVAVVAGIAYWQTRPQALLAPSASAPTATAGGPMVAVTVPGLSSNAALGQRLYDTACASCHGANAAGVEGTAPPLVHIYYEPNHHGDEAFQRAVAIGVTSHHWRFGNMPAQTGLTRGDVAMIITYIRELQRANGIR